MSLVQWWSSSSRRVGPLAVIRGEAYVGSNNEGKLPKIGATAGEGFESNVIEDENGRWQSRWSRWGGEKREGEEDVGATARGLRIDGGSDEVDLGEVKEARGETARVEELEGAAEAVVEGELSVAETHIKIPVEQRWLRWR
ncbi:hypothetical protein MRB53_003396 [Persea americana]|uniref:Uncharacterized protein n=1 Tax=Persea americana TaxID=3435 RepID=A0ACC2MXX4_PERAE|nr:hypothetical protein MRB53_003396 [Persea americana]